MPPFQARDSSDSPPAGLVGGAIGAAFAFVAVLAVLFFLFVRLNRKRPIFQPVQQHPLPEKPFKFNIPKRFRYHRKTPSDTLRLDPLLSSVHNHQYPTTDHERPSQELNYMLPVGHAPPVTYSSRRFTLPSPSDIQPMKFVPQPNNNNNNAILVQPDPINTRTDLNDALPKLRSPSRSNFTWGRYLPSLIIPTSPTAGTGLASSSHLTPGASNDNNNNNNNNDNASPSSDSPVSTYSQLSNSMYTNRTPPDIPDIPPVPPLPQGALDRNDTVVNLMKKRVNRIERALSRAYSRSSRVSRMDSFASVAPSDAAATATATATTSTGPVRTRRSTRKKSIKPSLLEKRAAKAELPARSPHATKGWRVHESPTQLRPLPSPPQLRRARSRGTGAGTSGGGPAVPPKPAISPPEPPKPRQPFPDTMGSLSPERSLPRRLPAPLFGSPPSYDVSLGVAPLNVPPRVLVAGPRTRSSKGSLKQAS